MSETSDVIEHSEVTVYWRPGCPYCSRLRRDLHRLGLPVTEVNIWEDPAGSAIVRSAAGGNETVPTVIVGSAALVNPSARAVVTEVQRTYPGRHVDDRVAAGVRRIRNLRTVQWALLIAVVVASITADGTGHSALSWGLDAVALAVWAAFRIFDR